ncbi:MAG: hypothetical protein EXS13_03790 [Planctomycetes bacterium]|nr:hypothetical protein [Planctomycetota bacterium]
MRLARAVIGWGGTLLIAVGAWRALALPWFGGDRGHEALGAEHVAMQRVLYAAMELGIGSDPLAVCGTWRGRLERGSGARGIRFIAPPELRIVNAALAGSPLHERLGGGEAWLAQPAALRVLDGRGAAGAGALALDLVVEFELPLLRERDAPLWIGNAINLLQFGATVTATALVARDGAIRIEALGADRFAIADPAAAGLAARPAAAVANASRPSCSFALDEASGALAVALGRAASSESGAGVLLLSDPGASTKASHRFLPLPADPRRVQWAANGSTLVVELSEARYATIDVVRGALRQVDTAVEVAPDGSVLLERTERAPGVHVQRLLDLASDGRGSQRIAGARALRFTLGCGGLVRAGPGGAGIECLAFDGSLRANLPDAAAACRAVIANPLGWCCVTDTLGGCRIAFSPTAGREPWQQQLELRVEAVSASADGREVVLVGAAARYAVVRIAPLAVERARQVEVVWEGDLRPIATPGRHGLLLADPTIRDATVAQRLWHLPAESIATGATPRLVAESARLDAPPVFGAQGRYLYYLRAPGGTLWRKDLLLGGDEPLLLHGR